MPRAAKKVQDEATKQIYRALKAVFPGLARNTGAVVYRYNPVSIRVRVIDPQFKGMSMAQREALIDRALAQLPRTVIDDITLLLALTPEEADDTGQLLSHEFDDPTGSRL